MTSLKALLVTALIGVSAGASPSLWAHGDAAHAKKASPIKMEQKAWGIAGEAKAVSRTVTFAMSDAMRFTPDKIEVKQGETVKFVIQNGGKVLHEMVIGTKKELEEHAALMLKFPDRKSVV